MIRKEDRWGDYSGCGIRRVCFEDRTQIIKEEIRSDNPDLVSVIIPEHIEKVAFRAFGGCKNLKDLHIEGDLSRLSGWSEEAFEDCVCEEYYKKVRYSALHSQLEERNAEEGEK